MQCRIKICIHIYHSSFAPLMYSGRNVAAGPCCGWGRGEIHNTCTRYHAHTRTHTHTRVCKHTHTHTHICTHINANVNTWVDSLRWCMWVRLRFTCVCICVCLYIHTFIHATHVYIYTTYIHIYIYLYINHILIYCVRLPAGFCCATSEQSVVAIATIS